ncbi:hypothetical protein L2E82_40933 [Cichorium intybus]|uniref:Uncharacterized protein n=1 Tax=Cichorium intybus TaxID=13427 RepID=A0ACB9AME0_CICIN|nr:hypothetical protein L2E82_40933 [Cichorium intybus]
MSKTSINISKNHHHRHHHPPTTLKPKVYITHSSSFKTLVQKLTGNNGTPESSIPPTVSPPPPDAGIHKDQHTHNNQHINSQDYIPVFDDSTWSTPFDQTNSLPDLQQSKTGYQIETNMDSSWLLEIGPFA